MPVSTLWSRPKGVQRPKPIRKVVIVSQDAAALTARDGLVSVETHDRRSAKGPNLLTVVGCSMSFCRVLDNGNAKTCQNIEVARVPHNVHSNERLRCRRHCSL